MSETYQRRGNLLLYIVQYIAGLLVGATIGWLWLVIVVSSYVAGGYFRLSYGQLSSHEQRILEATQNFNVLRTQAENLGFKTVCVLYALLMIGKIITRIT
jgi:hypothetical protein